MLRIFPAAICALTLLGPAAFAQSSMGDNMGNGSSSAMASGTQGSMSKNEMKPSDKTKPADTMKPTGGMSDSMAPSNGMSHTNTP